MKPFLTHYVILHFSPNNFRGERLNIGYVVFPENGLPACEITATVKKIRALDPEFKKEDVIRLEAFIQEIITASTSHVECFEKLEKFGFCNSKKIGFFSCKPSGFSKELRQIAALYIDNQNSKSKKSSRTTLHSEICEYFKVRDLLGAPNDSIALHKVIPWYPMPNYPDLKADFAYKNGVYRITQTFDYRVSRNTAHLKISEACTKVTAATSGAKAWGDETKRFAIINVPHEIADVADSHIDLLLANDFEIFKSDDKGDMERYFEVAFS